MHRAQYAILDRLADPETIPPTVRELSEITGLSLAGVRYHYDALVTAGWITHVPHLPRTTRITDEGRMALAAEERN